MGLSFLFFFAFASLLFTAICNGMSFTVLGVVLAAKVSRMVFHIRNVKSEEQKGRLRKW